MKIPLSLRRLTFNACGVQSERCSTPAVYTAATRRVGVMSWVFCPRQTATAHGRAATAPLRQPAGRASAPGLAAVSRLNPARNISGRSAGRGDLHSTLKDLSDVQDRTIHLCSIASKRNTLLDTMSGEEQRQAVIHSIASYGLSQIEALRVLVQRRCDHINAAAARAAEGREDVPTNRKAAAGPRVLSDWRPWHLAAGHGGRGEGPAQTEADLLSFRLRGMKLYDTISDGVKLIQAMAASDEQQAVADSVALHCLSEVEVLSALWQQATARGARADGHRREDH